MKKIVFFVVFSLSFLLFYSVQAQEIKPDKVISASFNTPVEINDQEWKTDFKDVISVKNPDIIAGKLNTFVKKYYPGGLNKKNQEDFIKRFEQTTLFPWVCVGNCSAEYEACMASVRTYPARAICESAVQNCWALCFAGLPPL